MSLFRAIRRLTGFFISLISFSLIAVTLSLQKKYYRKKYNRDLGWQPEAYFTRVWAMFGCILLGMKVKVEGYLPRQGPALIVANHIGSPDIFVLGSLFRAFFVSKADVGRWPLVGNMMKRGGALLVDRDRKLGARHLRRSIAERLAEGYKVIMFPEGRASDGSSVLPFKHAGFQAAVDANCPVIPVVIIYHDGKIPSIACWNTPSFMSHFWPLLKNKNLEATVHVLPAFSPGTDRKKLAQACHQVITECYETKQKEAGLFKD